jgi:hypothetical protein
MAKKQSDDTTPESGLVDQVITETTTVGVEEVTSPILNEAPAERVDPGHTSRDFFSQA